MSVPNASLCTSRARPVSMDPAVNRGTGGGMTKPGERSNAPVIERPWTVD